MTVNKAKAIFIAGSVVAIGAFALFGGDPAPIEPTPAQVPATVELQDKYEISKQDAIRGEIKTDFSKTSPEVTLSKWSGQASLKLKYALNAQAEKDADGKIKYRTAQQEVHSYPLLAGGDGINDGGMETEVIFHSKPSSPVIEFPVENYEDFDFIYTPPFTDPFWNFVGIKDIVSCTENKCLDKDGNVVESMPDNAVGSYEIRHKTLANHYPGQVNHETGIFGYMLRPQLTDGAGNKTWGKLSYIPGKFLVTIPDSVYHNPQTDWSNFIADPTFGYTTLGTATDATGKFANANFYTASADCDPVTAYYGGFMASGTGTVYVGIYDGEASLAGNTLLDVSSGIGLIANGSAGSFQSAAITGTDLVNGTSYWLEAYSNTVGVNTKYSANAFTDTFTNTGAVATPPSTHAATGGTQANTQLSIYVDCAASGPATPSTHQVIIID